jgi:predicted phage terminase large subunit-like protein
VKLTSAVIQGFVDLCLAKGFDGQAPSPPFHKECWELCCSHEKYVAIAAPRGHAKSTAITLGYGLATLLFRERKFMLLVSDTESQASLFLGLFKEELQNNQDLIDLFGLKKNDKGQTEFLKDSETDIIVQCADGHKFRVIAKGAEQKLRGLIWNGSRPDIILCDDMENDELVMNKDRRKKMRDWFKGALLPSLSDRGVVRMVGTILHSDSLLESLMPNPSDKHTHKTDLKEWTTRRMMWKTVKYRAHSKDFNTLLWPEKKTHDFFKVLYEDAVRTGTTDTYSREYLNYPIDEAVSFFKRPDFLGISEEDKQKTLNYYVTADLAISELDAADYSVFIVAGIDEEKRIHVKNVIRERLDGKEIVDMLLQLQRMYNPNAVGIEEMQVSKAIGPFLREEMIKQNVFLSLHMLKHGGKDKLTRARSIQARMRAHGVKFAKEEDWFPNFEDECLTFPRGKHDDQVDAFAYLGMMLDLLIEAPTSTEQAEEDWELEVEASGMNDLGRSHVTGY